MKTRLLKWSGGSLFLTLGIALVIPFTRYSMLGYIRSENFEEGRPTSYWADALKSTDAEIREHAAVCLARIGPEAASAAPALIAALDDDVMIVRAKAAFALFKLRVHDEAAVPKLTARLKDSHPLVRLYASMCLSQVGPSAEAAIPELIEAVNDKQNAITLFHSDINTRQLAIVAIGRVGPHATSALTLLNGLLEDEDIVVRRVAVNALGKIGSRDSIPVLVAILQNESNPIRPEAANALGDFGHNAKEAVPLLTKMAKDKSAFVRMQAESALKQIDPQPGSERSN